MIVHKLPVSTRLICNCERLCQMMRTIRSISIPGWFSPPWHQARPQTPMSCHCHGVMFSAGHLGSPGSGSRERSFSGRNYNSPPHRLSTLHWEHYPHRILRHCPCLCLALTSQQTLVHMYSILKVSTFQDIWIFSSNKMSPSWWRIIKRRLVSPTATHTHYPLLTTKFWCAMFCCLSFIL